MFVSLFSWELRLKHGVYFYDGTYLDRAESLSRGDERIAHFAARLVYEKGNMGIGLFTIGLMLGNTLLLYPILKLFGVH